MAVMKYFIILTKFALSAVLVFFLCKKVDFSLFTTTIEAHALAWALSLGVGLVFVQSILASIRYTLILKQYKVILDFQNSFRTHYIGSFFSQVLISFIGGDAMRIWCLTRLSLPLKIAATSILHDRIIGFLSIMIMYLGAMPVIYYILPTSNLKLSTMLLGLFCLVSLISFLAMGYLKEFFNRIKILKFLSFLPEISQFITRSFNKTTKIMIFSFGIHLINIIAIYLFACLYNIEISFFWCLIVGLPAILISMLPISFAGWGVREGALAIGFGLLGLPPEKGILISMTLGLVIVINSIPGIILFLFEKRQTHKQRAIGFIP